jgi:hypothetical protein
VSRQVASVVPRANLAGMRILRWLRTMRAVVFSSAFGQRVTGPEQYLMSTTRSAGWIVSTWTPWPLGPRVSCSTANRRRPGGADNGLCVHCCPGEGAGCGDGVVGKTGTPGTRTAAAFTGRNRNPGRSQARWAGRQHRRVAVVVYHLGAMLCICGSWSQPVTSSARLEQ